MRSGAMQFALWKYPIHFMACGFGVGFVPILPGTLGSLIGVCCYWFMAPLGHVVYAGIVFVLAFVGIFICGLTASDLGLIDPSFIVWDEIVGFLVAMYLMRRDWRWILAGFLVYRVFDMWKPYPLHLFEQGPSLGLSIMADDIGAGIYTAAVLHLLFWTGRWLRRA